MIISSVHINSYKSVHKLKLPLDSNVTVLIGPNESGKTNILKSIEHFKPTCDLSVEHTCQFSSYYQECKPPQISLELTKFTREDQAKLGKIYEGFKSAESILIRREGPSNKDYKLQTDSKVISIGDINPIFEHLPKILYFESIQVLKDRIDIDSLHSKSNDTKTERNLLTVGGVEDIDLIFEDSTRGRRIAEEASREITKRIREVWTQEPSLEIKLRVNGNLLYIDFSDATRVYDTPKTRSRGFLWYLSFYINFIAATNEAKVNEYLFLFDEPGMHLHPSGQKDLTSLLEQLSIKNQLIYTTHSPFMINREHPERVRVVQKDPEGTKVDSEAYRDNWRPLRESIGLTVGDLFFFHSKSLVLDLPERKQNRFKKNK
ncbi:AAA family ATPase [bacterium]|nr:AAA family ATPase [bacterium]